MKKQKKKEKKKWIPRKQKKKKRKEKKRKKEEKLKKKQTNKQTNKSGFQEKNMLPRERTDGFELAVTTKLVAGRSEMSTIIIGAWAQEKKEWGGGRPFRRVVEHAHGSL